MVKHSPPVHKGTYISNIVYVCLHFIAFLCCPQQWAVLENDLKWRQTEWSENLFTWQKAKAALDILEQNG